MTSADHILYGVPHSLYTGKTRAYLRKQGIVYEERTPASPEFREQIMPVIGRSIIPVVVTPDGEIIQDTVDILDHFEATGARVSAYPPGARQRVLAHVLELYAVVTLSRHAMHYRWSYFDQQEAFLVDAFARGSGREAAEAVMRRMASYLPGLGVTPETIPVIEESYRLLLANLEAHFSVHPYLFGGEPSVGDYGLFGPLFAHLGRDPIPADQMKREAPRVARWVERMNAPDPDLPEYRDYPPAYLDGDAVPETLAPLLAQVAEELLPEAEAKLAAFRAFVEANDPQEGAPVAPKPHQRVIGLTASSFRGVACETVLQPYMLYLWQRVTDAWEALEPRAADEVRQYLGRFGLDRLLTAERPIRVERRNHIEVWGPRQGASLAG